MLRVEGARSSHDAAAAAVAAAAAAGGDGDVGGQGGGQWTGLQQEGRGLDGHCCWRGGGHRQEAEGGPGSTQPGTGAKAGCTWAAGWRRRGLWGAGRSGDNWAAPGRRGTGRQRPTKSWTRRRLPSCYQRTSKGTSLAGRGQKRRQGAEGGAREQEWGPFLGQEEVHPYPAPWHGERADAQVGAGLPGQEERLMHCSGASKQVGEAGLVSHVGRWLVVEQRVGFHRPLERLMALLGERPQPQSPILKWG